MRINHDDKEPIYLGKDGNIFVFEISVNGNPFKVNISDESLEPLQKCIDKTKELIDNEPKDIMASLRKLNFMSVEDAVK